jgi:hypothetical protein
MPKRLVYAALLVALICTLLGVVLVMVGGLALQQMPNRPPGWARSAMAVGCILLLPFITVAYLSDIVAYVSIIPLQAGWYLALFWAGWKITQVFR